MPQNEYAWLRDQMAEIGRDVADIKTDVATIKTGCQSYAKSITDLESSVYGNGKEGLKTTVLKQGNEIDAIKKERNRDWSWVAKIAVVVGWLVTTGCYVYQTLAK
jgi:hypothetical protein